MSDMKLEIGQFIRFNGFISKIINIQISKTTGRKFIQFREPTGLLAKTYEKNITKSSFNLIELIEVGDFVNGEYMLEHYLQHDRIEHTYNSYWFEQDIKEILTHEQYEANCYKVGE